MKNIHIIAVSNNKQHTLYEAVNTYCERIKPYAKITINIISQEPFRDIGEKNNVQKKEWDKIEKQITQNSRVYLLDALGKNYTSEEFAQKIKTETTHGDTLCFIIGGSLGLPEEQKKKYPLLSLSTFTMPHELALVVLLEQLYRAETILMGKQYHY